MRIKFSWVQPHHGSNSTSPLLTNHNCFAGKPNLAIDDDGWWPNPSLNGSLITMPSAFLHQLHKVPIIILCPMMEYSTLHLSIIIVIIIIIIIISNKWNRIHCKEENRKLFLIFVICKTKGYRQNQILAQYWFQLSTCTLLS